jgi:UDP-glucose 4-epimerase
LPNDPRPWSNAPGEQGDFEPRGETGDDDESGGTPEQAASARMSLYLVTGGAGFIGSHLCDALIARGDEVRVLDDLSTGHRANLPAGAALTIGDIADPDAAMRATEGVDGCFHLAAIASVERGVNDWLGSHRANLTGTISIFDAIRRHGTKAPVVYASSAAVYGDCATIPIAEAAERRPLSAYGADKYGCELHAITASHVHGIPTVGLRFFNVYGPRQDPKSPYSGVISIFAERILKGAPIHIFGDGTQTRDFIYVTDVVAALLAGMSLRPANAQVFNVCTGEATSVSDLALVIATLAGKNPDARPMPPRAGEIRHSLGDRSHARRVLGLGDTVTLHDGLATVLTWLGASQQVGP